MNRYWWLVGLAVALLVVAFAPLASAHPDGLERVAENQGFARQAKEPLLCVLPDYVFPGVAGEAFSTVLSGVVGVVATFLLMFGLGKALSRRSAVH